MHSPVFISAWNEGHYTNQPEWLDTHTLLVSAQRSGETQNDIYSLDLTTHIVTRLTATPQSEFSPIATPNGQSFTVVRQEHGDVMNQQIVELPLKLDSEGVELLPRIRNIGYYCWLSDEDLALCLVGESTKLAFTSLRNGTPQVYSSGIGRCLRFDNFGNLIYVHKYSDTFWFLKSLNLVTRTSQILIETLSGKEDFALGPDGSYFMASGSILYVFHPERSDHWMPVYDLAVFGLHNITRLAISEDNQIAIVDQRE